MLYIHVCVGLTWMLVTSTPFIYNILGYETCSLIRRLNCHFVQSDNVDLKVVKSSYNSMHSFMNLLLFLLLWSFLI